MAGQNLIPSGDFRTSYSADTTIFPTTTSRNAAIVGIVLICFAPLIFSEYWLSILIQIGIFAIAALGLNILVGFTGQISIGHAAFFLLGAFTSAYISNTLPIPVFFAIPLAGVVVAVVNGVSSGLSAYGIKVFPAAILGGLDSIGGAVLGGIIIGLLENIAQYIDSEYLHWGNLYEVAPFYVLIIILMIKPYGLFGTKDIERI